MKRMQLSPDEAKIIEGLRQQKAIWNEAIAAAVARLHSFNHSGEFDALEHEILQERKS